MTDEQRVRSALEYDLEPWQPDPASLMRRGRRLARTAPRHELQRPRRRHTEDKRHNAEHPPFPAGTMHGFRGRPGAGECGHGTQRIRQRQQFSCLRAGRAGGRRAKG